MDDGLINLKTTKSLTEKGILKSSNGAYLCCGGFFPDEESFRSHVRVHHPPSDYYYDIPIGKIITLTVVSVLGWIIYTLYRSLMAPKPIEEDPFTTFYSDLEL